MRGGQKQQQHALSQQYSSVRQRDSLPALWPHVILCSLQTKYSNNERRRFHLRPLPAQQLGAADSRDIYRRTHKAGAHLCVGVCERERERVDWGGLPNKTKKGDSTLLTLLLSLVRGSPRESSSQLTCALHVRAARTAAQPARLEAAGGPIAGQDPCQSAPAVCSCASVELQQSISSCEGIAKLQQSKTFTLLLNELGLRIQAVSHPQRVQARHSFIILDQIRPFKAGDSRQSFIIWHFGLQGLRIAKIRHLPGNYAD